MNTKKYWLKQVSSVCFTLHPPTKLTYVEDLLKELQDALGTALGEESRTQLSTAIDSISA
jgi:hypothetical protein